MVDARGISFTIPHPVTTTPTATPYTYFTFATFFSLDTRVTQSNTAYTFTTTAVFENKASTVTETLTFTTTVRFFPDGFGEYQGYFTFKAPEPAFTANSQSTTAGNGLLLPYSPNLSLLSSTTTTLEVPSAFSSHCNHACHLCTSILAHTIPFVSCASKVASAIVGVKGNSCAADDPKCLCLKNTIDTYACASVGCDSENATTSMLDTVDNFCWTNGWARKQRLPHFTISKTPAPQPSNGHGISGGAIAGIVVGVLVAIGIASGVLLLWLRYRRRRRRQVGLKGELATNREPVPELTEVLPRESDDRVGNRS